MIRYLMLIAASSLIVGTGCRHRCCLNDPDRRPRPYQPSAPTSPLLLPPAGLPTTPAPATLPPGAPNPVIPPVGPTQGNYPPPDFGPRTVPPSTKPGAEVLFPEPVPGTSSRSSYPGEPGSGLFGSPASSQQTTEPPATSKRGLPGFVQVEEGLASGRKPTLDGYDSLKQAGYRTVIYLYAAGADVSAPREVAEKRGFSFTGIETSPEKLASAVDAFNLALSDRSSRPAYVFDDDGVRAGVLWYLHFRTAEGSSDEVARVRAKPLGYGSQGTDSQAFALAIQRFLETR